MPAKIKICGITNISDARLAVELGADLLGFNFYESSPRYINPLTAADIIQQLPSKVVNVGLFVTAGAESIAQVLQTCPLEMIQLHGDENNHDCLAAAKLGPKIIKALRIRRKEDLDLMSRFEVKSILLDAFHPDLYGGSGQKFDWSWIKQNQDKNIYLAGGITPENISEALSAGTYGVDLCSGVESKPGVKDPEKLIKLFDNIHKYYDQ